ncbi:MAG: hypothetical protein WBV41_03185, partial [Terriglobales bacterium]
PYQFLLLQQCELEVNDYYGETVGEGSGASRFGNGDHEASSYPVPNTTLNERQRLWLRQFAFRIARWIEREALPLPAFVLHPLTALVIAGVHVYLASEHLLKLFGGDVEWTHIWKGFGALAGAYVFAVLASRGRLKRKVLDQRTSELIRQSNFTELDQSQS